MSSLNGLLYHLSCGVVVRKLVFYFAPIHHPYYYPYGEHNIVLEQTNEGYVRVQFYHYYNVKNERVDIPLPQQYYDFCALEQLLYQHPILYYSFYTRLLRPFFPYYESPSSSLLVYESPSAYHGQVTDSPAVSTSYVTTLDSTSH